MVAVILMISMTVTEVVAGERITDSELSTLYGGWGFYNPYCIVTTNGCANHTLCESPEDDGHPCRFCNSEIGQKCKNNWSIIPDFDGCNNGTKPCENGPFLPPPDPAPPGGGPPAAFGYCCGSECFEAYWDPDTAYPNCGETDNYDYCDD